MNRCTGLALVPAPLRRDRETRRWYTDGAEACLVLTEHADLLEPLPTFGPSCYLRIGNDVTLREANEYASKRGHFHARNLR